MNLSISILWSIWHLPAIIYGGYLIPSPYWLGLALFFINLTLASFIMGWIRQKTGGVIAPILVHAANNIGMVLTGVSGIILGETGIILTLLLIVFVIVTKAWKAPRLFEFAVLKEKYLGK